MQVLKNGSPILNRGILTAELKILMNSGKKQSLSELLHKALEKTAPMM